MYTATLPLHFAIWCTRATDRPELEALPDNELVRCCSSTDHEPFRILVRRHKDRLFSLAMRQVGERAVAEDLVQEIFIRAYRGLTAFRQQASFSTWITRIALNQINSYFTSRRFREQRMSQPFNLLHHDTDTPQRDPEIDEGHLQAFREGLAKLKPIHRNVLVLCGLEEKSYEEAARILNIPVGTVRSRLNHARQQLSRTLLGT